MTVMFALLMLGSAGVPDDQGWKRLLPGPDELNDFEYHPDTIERTGDMVHIWNRNNIVSFDSTTMAFSKHGRYFWRSEIDCRRRLIREIQGVSRRTVNGRIEDEAQPATEFAPILDGSIGGYLEQAVCPTR